MKRKVNRTKRAKIGSHGFKVYKGTVVYIGRQTENKHGVDEKLVSMLQDLWNNNESTKRMRKFIKHISIKRSTTLGGLSGRWNYEKSKVEIIQHRFTDINWYRGTFYHEIEGHAFWDFSRKWRRDNLIKFNNLANRLPPVNDYVKNNEYKWKHINDDSDMGSHPSMTRYANEQHSAVTEYVRNVMRREQLIFQEGMDELVELWKELHY